MGQLMTQQSLSWGGIARLGLVQAAIGALVVLATSTMNRIMVVELALPAVLPGLLVALHYAVQVVRPRFGHGSDVGGRLTRWIIFGMLVLVSGAIVAAVSIALMAVNRPLGIICAALAYFIIGIGVGACGTSLLVLLAKQVEPSRRAAAATITWVMMIAGFVITTGVASKLLEPYSHQRLLSVVAGVGVVALIVTSLALWGIEQGDATTAASARAPRERTDFAMALAQVWREPVARQFTMFVFISMLAYSGQELIFEPFAGTVFHFTPAQSSGLASLQHGGALCGMVLVALLGTLAARSRLGSLRGWMVGGCLGSALALLGLVVATQQGGAWPVRPNTFVLGLANGIFTVSAIGSMMKLASSGGPARQGIRMGLWGAAQAVAFAIGGLFSSAAVDIVHRLTHSAIGAYGGVFAAQAMLFGVAAILALTIGAVEEKKSEPTLEWAPQSR
jgi:MFS transporter, BCD family, chlorophyll transporter